MTNKEIAERLDKILAEDNNWSSSRKLTEMVKELCYELEPPKPEPGTVVWWRHDESSPWAIAYVGKFSIECEYGYFPPDVGEWKPARICVDDEVVGVPGELVRHNDKTYKILEIQPVGEWPKWGDAIFVKYGHSCSEGRSIITRAEAERVEAGGRND